MRKVQIILNIVLLIIVILLCTDKCGREKISTYDINKKKVDSIESANKVMKDSLLQLISEKDKESEQFKGKLSMLKIQIEDIKKRKIEIPPTVQASSDYYNERYNTTENKKVDSSVVLGYDTSSLVITEIEEGDRCKQVIMSQGEVISIQDTLIDNLVFMRKKNELLVAWADQNANSQKKLRLQAEESIKDLEKKNKKLKRKSFFTTYILPPVAFFIGTKINK
jgi:hypothetical protein